MAGRGPVGKPEHVRQRNDAEFEKFAETGELFGSPLPDGVLPNDEQWHPQTVALWDSLRRSPLLKDEPELGWQFLIDTALMHHTMWLKGKWEFASEVRLRVAKFGATPEDRMRLKIKVQTLPRGPVQDEGVSSVTNIRSRRSRLSG